MTKLTSENGFTKENVREEYMTQSKKAGVVRTLCLFLLLVISTGGQLARAQEQEVLTSQARTIGKAVQMFFIRQSLIRSAEPCKCSLFGKASYDRQSRAKVLSYTSFQTIGEAVQRVETLPEVPEVREVQVEPVEYVDTVLVRPIDRTTDRIHSSRCPVSGEEFQRDSLAPDSTEVKRGKPFMALRTNMLYDAALIPNIGLEVAIGDHWSIAVDWWYTWFYSDPRHLYWQSYGGYLTARFYFGKANALQRLTGHHVGIYGTALTYDVEFGGTGYQAAKFGFGGGVEYGYSLPVGHSLTIDFNLGIGYQGGEYKVYEPTNDGSGHYVWQSTHLRRWWGPTKAEIALKWLISSSKGRSSKGSKGSKGSISMEGQGAEAEEIHSSELTEQASQEGRGESTPPAQSATSTCLRGGVQGEQGAEGENGLNEQYAAPEGQETKPQSAEPEASPAEGEKGGER